MYIPYSFNLYPNFFALFRIIKLKSFEPVKYNKAGYHEIIGIKRISILLTGNLLYLQNPIYLFVAVGVISSIKKFSSCNFLIICCINFSSSLGSDVIINGVVTNTSTSFDVNF